MTAKIMDRATDAGRSTRTRIAIDPGAIRSNEGWTRLMGSFPLDKPDR